MAHFITKRSWLRYLPKQSDSQPVSVESMTTNTKCPKAGPSGDCPEGFTNVAWCTSCHLKPPEPASSIVVGPLSEHYDEIEDDRKVAKILAAPSMVAGQVPNTTLALASKHLTSRFSGRCKWCGTDVIADDTSIVGIPPSRWEKGPLLWICAECANVYFYVDNQAENVLHRLKRGEAAYTAFHVAPFEFEYVWDEAKMAWVVARVLRNGTVLPTRV